MCTRQQLSRLETLSLAANIHALNVFVYKTLRGTNFREECVYTLTAVINPTENTSCVLPRRYCWLVKTDVQRHLGTFHVVI